MPDVDSEKPTDELDRRLIQTGHGQPTPYEGMSTPLRAFVWIVVAAAFALWLVAVWIMLFVPKPEQLFHLLPS
jgi:hypothetical protein